ncbi:hypothetical protein D3C80_1669450 [compost metagenome]
MLVTGERLAVAFPGEQRRWTLFTQQQLLVTRIPGDTFKSLVLVFRRPEVIFGEIGEVQFAGVGIDFDDGDLMVTFIDNGQQAVAQHGDTFRVAPAHQWHFA